MLSFLFIDCNYFFSAFPYFKEAGARAWLKKHVLMLGVQLLCKIYNFQIKNSLKVCEVSFYIMKEVLWAGFSFFGCRK